MFVLVCDITLLFQRSLTFLVYISTKLRLSLIITCLSSYAILLYSGLTYGLMTPPLDTSDAVDVPAAHISSTLIASVDYRF